MIQVEEDLDAHPLLDWVHPDGAKAAAAAAAATNKAAEGTKAKAAEDATQKTGENCHKVGDGMASFNGKMRQRAAEQARQ